MITVDPERDTASKLEKYLNFFDPTFYGLTGTQEEITAIEQAYGIVAIREATGTQTPVRYPLSP